MTSLEQVAAEIKRQGFNIDAGPFENGKYQAVHGARLVRIRTILTPKQIKHLGLTIKKPDAPGKPRSLRFLVTETEDGFELSHVTSSQRKRRKPRKKRRPE